MSDWSSLGPISEVFKGLDWSGNGPAIPSAGSGVEWYAIAQLLGISTTISDGYADILAHLKVVATTESGGSASQLAHLLGTATTLSDGSGAPLAYLKGVADTVSDGSARIFKGTSGTATTISDGSAALLAHLFGTATTQSDSIAPLLAHLIGTGTTMSDASATAVFTAHALQDNTWTTAQTTTYTIPSWAIFLDIVGCSAGGGGAEGDGTFASKGNGGKAGSWNGITLQRGVDIPWSAGSISVTVPAGGLGAPKTTGGNPGSPGGNLVISWTGGSMTIPGGLGGTGTTAITGTPGLSPGNFTFAGQTFTGGAQRPSATSNSQVGPTGNPPGGGGGGGGGGYFNGQAAGGPGAPGMAAIRARQT